MDTCRFWNHVFNILEKKFGPSFNDNPEPSHHKHADIELILKQFLLSLKDDSISHSQEHQKSLYSFISDPRIGELTQFLINGLERIHAELQKTYFANPRFKMKIDQFLDKKEDSEKAPLLMRELFFPEGNLDKDESIKQIREERTVFIHTLNKNPVQDPANELLFTANALITTPASLPLDENRIPPDISSQIKNSMGEPQKYFYDHPIPLDCPNEANEVLYGLNGLNEMMEFEKMRGNAAKNKKLDVVLSVSTTHTGLQGPVKEWLQLQIAKFKKFKHLNVYAFTETDCRALVEEVLQPAGQYFLKLPPGHPDFSIFGVDGHYGRHYSFLKAIAPLWQLIMNPSLKGTFKIDLDQVFPQDQLVAETGKSAFEHLMSPMWGAEGIDQQGFPFEMGMIAGALVNEQDASQGLFTPDVKFPSSPRSAGEFIFQSQYPQAISTRAEMMAQYNGPEFSRGNLALHRIHVTGGTNGILISALKKYQPFSPSFFGRAEDQAYIMSTFNFWPKHLAYLHQPGFIMRHDKHSFAHEAIKSSAMSKLIGDYIRILYFSAYARSFPSPAYRIKDYLKPFTGAFISDIPVTLVYLRFVFKGLELLQSGSDSKIEEFFKTGPGRLDDAIRFTTGMHNEQFQQKIMAEKNSWSMYYMILDLLEKEIAGNNKKAEKLISSARKIIKNTKIL